LVSDLLDYIRNQEDTNPQKPYRRDPPHSPAEEHNRDQKPCSLTTPRGRRACREVSTWSPFEPEYDQNSQSFHADTPFCNPLEGRTLGNRLSYVLYNSVHYVDPTGYKWSWKAFFGIVAAVALVIATAGAAAPGVAAAAGAYGAAEVAAGTLASWATTAAVVSAVSGAAYLATPSGSSAMSSASLPTIGVGAASAMALAGLPELATAGVAPISAGARLGMGAATAGELAVPGVGEVVGGAIAGILLYKGAAAVRQAYEEWDRGFEIIGYHATTAAAAISIRDNGFDITRSDRLRNNRFGRGYYLSDTPQHAAAEYVNKYGYQPEAILQVRARLTKNLIVGGPLAERPISRWIGAGGRAVGGSLMYGAFAPEAEDGINYVLFDPLHQVRNQERVR